MDGSPSSEVNWQSLHEFLHDLQDSVNRRDVVGVAGLFAVDVIFEYVRPDKQLRGREHLKEMFAGIFTS